MSVYDILKRGAVRIVGGLIRRVHYRLLDRGYDRNRGIDTAGIYQPHELSIVSDNVRFASEYAPTPTRGFRRMIASLDVDFRHCVFADLGSGKGRTLLLAAELPFLRIEGVEFASELHQIALRNIARFAGRGHRHDHIVIHHVDASEYQIPEEPCIFYLYNPFGEPVLSRVLNNAEAAYRKRARPMYFIYLNPKHRNVFDQRAFIRPMTRSWIAHFGDLLTLPEPFVVYRTSD